LGRVLFTPKSEPAVDWSTRYFKWNDTTSDVRKKAPSQAAFASLTEVLVQRAPRLDLEGYRAFNPQVPREYFAVEGTGSVDLSPGEYTLRTISDDGVRVWIDGSLVIDNWTPHESALDFAPLKGGHHDLRVQYYQADGWYEVSHEGSHKQFKHSIGGNDYGSANSKPDRYG